jgi:hypothetical protein
MTTGRRASPGAGQSDHNNLDALEGPNRKILLRTSQNGTASNGVPRIRIHDRQYRPSINALRHQYIFEPFYTTRRTFGKGWGCGSPNSGRKHGGTIQMRTTPRIGWNGRLHQPLTEVHASEARVFQFNQKTPRRGEPVTWNDTPASLLFVLPSCFSIPRTLTGTKLLTVSFNGHQDVGAAATCDYSFFRYDHARYAQRRDRSLTSGTTEPGMPTRSSTGAEANPSRGVALPVLRLDAFVQTPSATGRDVILHLPAERRWPKTSSSHAPSPMDRVQYGSRPSISGRSDDYVTALVYP